jgi:hypothetical protein
MTSAVNRYACPREIFLSSINDAMLVAEAPFLFGII